MAISTQNNLGQSMNRALATTIGEKVRRNRGRVVKPLIDQMTEDTFSKLLIEVRKSFQDHKTIIPQIKELRGTP